MDVAAGNKTVVEDLRNAYEGWWSSLEPVFDEEVRIGIGAPVENPTQLSPHDWHVADQSQSVWNHRQVEAGMMGNGFWAVDVVQPGTYIFELRRWPRHQDGPLESVQARLRIGSRTWVQPVDASDTKASFHASLDAGPTSIQTWFELPDGTERGAYFLYVERLESHTIDLP